MKMQTQVRLVFVLAIVLSAASSSFAAIYKYTDNTGMICFANDLQSIPQQYRATAKIVSGESEGEQKPLQQNKRQTQQEATPAVTDPDTAREPALVDPIKDGFSINRMLISGIVLVSALFAFVILRILDVDHKKSIKIVRAFILWGVSVYLLIAHGGDVVNMFRNLKSEVDMAQHQSREKGKKAAKAMKEINALIQNVDDAASQDSRDDADPKKKD